MTYEVIRPAEGEVALTWPEKDRLLLEVTMGVPESDSEVPYTDESRRLRRRLRKQVREMRRDDIGVDFVKD